MIPVRASGLSELFDCPARWEAKHILKKRLPTSSAAALGTAVHAGAAVYDQSAIDAQMLSIDDCAGVVVDSIWHPSEDVDWSDTTQNSAEKIALALHRKYCEEAAPQFDFIAVEGTCEPLILDDLGIMITGTTDRVFRDEEGKLGIADLKTGKTAVNSDGICKTSGHAAQIGLYELLVSNTLGQPMEADAHIIGLQTGATAKAQRVAVGTIVGATDLVLGTDEAPGMLDHAARIINSGSFYGNSRSQLCSAKFCPIYENCTFRR